MSHIPRTVIRIGPQDHGRRMNLDEFYLAEALEGRLYELSRGVVSGVDVPGPRHLAQVIAIRRQFAAYDLAHPGRIYGVAGGSDCKIPIAGVESERHPDLAVYKTPPPQEQDVWATYIPEIVIEVISPESEHRDYVEKREEYLLFGVREYWVVDAAKQEVLVLRRSRGQWVERRLRPPEVYRTRLLPGFQFDCGRVFQAAQATRS